MNQTLGQDDPGVPVKAEPTLALVASGLDHGHARLSARRDRVIAQAVAEGHTTPSESSAEHGRIVELRVAAARAARIKKGGFSTSAAAAGKKPDAEHVPASADNDVVLPDGIEGIDDAGEDLKALLQGDFDDAEDFVREGIDDEAMGEGESQGDDEQFVRESIPDAGLENDDDVLNIADAGPEDDDEDFSLTGFNVFAPAASAPVDLAAPENSPASDSSSDGDVFSDAETGTDPVSLIAAMNDACAVTSDSKNPPAIVGDDEMSRAWRELFNAIEDK